MPHPCEAGLDRLDRLAHRMDATFGLPGARLRIGLNAVHDLGPGIGIGFGFALALVPTGWIILKARQLDTPRSPQSRMVANAAMDGVIGSIPLLGNLFDIGQKANLRNERLPPGHLGVRSETERDIRDEGPEFTRTS